MGVSSSSPSPILSRHDHRRVSPYCSPPLPCHRLKFESHPIPIPIPISAITQDVTPCDSSTPSHHDITTPSRSPRARPDSHPVSSRKNIEIKDCWAQEPYATSLMITHPSTSTPTTPQMETTTRLGTRQIWIRNPITSPIIDRRSSYPISQQHEIPVIRRLTAPPQYTSTNLSIPAPTTCSTPTYPSSNLTIPPPPHITACPTPSDDIPLLTLPAIATLTEQIDRALIFSLHTVEPSTTNTSLQLLHGNELSLSLSTPVRRKSISSQPPLTLMDVLHHSQALDLFAGFLAHHACDESLSFWRDAIRYQRKWETTNLTASRHGSQQSSRQGSRRPSIDTTDVIRTSTTTTPMGTSREILRTSTTTTPMGTSRLIDRSGRMLSSVFEMAGEWKWQAMYDDACKIYHRHIPNLNLSADVSNQLASLFDATNPPPSHDLITAQLFIPAVDEILDMLKSDSFLRFTQTSQYQHLLKIMAKSAI